MNQNFYHQTKTNVQMDNGRAPKFYRQSFHAQFLSFIFGTIINLAVSFALVGLLLSIFGDKFDAQFLQLGINYDYGPVLIIIVPLYLVILWSWISNLIFYVGFSKEYRKYKNNFPFEPTNYVKKSFIFLHTKRNSLAGFAAAVYITLILSVAIIYFVVFSINSGNLGGANTVQYTARLVITGLDSNGQRMESDALRFYLIVVGLIASIFLVLHILTSLFLKLRINQIENYYSGADNVVDPTTLAEKIKKVNRRNMILFAIYMVILIILFILIIKLPKKIFPKLNLKTKLWG